MWREAFYLSLPSQPCIKLHLFLHLPSFYWSIIDGVPVGVNGLAGNVGVRFFEQGEVIGDNVLASCWSNLYSIHPYGLFLSL